MDQSLDDYVKEHKISGRGRGRGRGRGGGFYNRGSAGNVGKGGAKKGLMPTRTAPKRTAPSKTRGGVQKRGAGTGRGTGRGKGQKRNATLVPNNSQSQAAAKKRLLQAKKTLQLAIQEATKVTKMSRGGMSRGTRGRGRSNFGTNRAQTQRNFNTKYLDRLDSGSSHFRSGNSKPSFFNTGSNSDRVVSARGRRGRGRGRGRF